ncbi:MAG: 30S ribosomal protein S2 [Candidatus Colwellbacteria bacterium CG10_big_fil_rev_8_21_14_0_10_41_28]|uniref:Small ribosomal subunit protein uS2 n=1 Tax=Candidatus Colwellbacteria bacterium CG10_big_fil_rev_8_21_14_0_10_41_28 TaxID=1974539 RepID=A0A2H0VHF1_9BACT|nr:MAG: 30S ribosomal protein S2 [Candidatus Colwellbacteria bacterium CG10_big_fil_rev_8_21_14_0_10_41_28]
MDDKNVAEATAKTEEKSVQKAQKDEASSLNAKDTKAIEEMMEFGMFYGRSKSRTNPKMKPFIMANRSGFEVIDLEKTIFGIDRVVKAIKDIYEKGGEIVLVGTSPASKRKIREVGEATNTPYVNERWLGGTLTNFETISKRIKHLRKLKEQKASGGWEKYTKKEELSFKKELLKLEKLLGGIEHLNKIPQMVLIADIYQNEIPSREARQMGVDVAAIINTDSDPDKTDYIIPANDRSIQSVEYILDIIKEAIVEAKTKAPKQEAVEDIKKNG